MVYDLLIIVEFGVCVLSLPITSQLLHGSQIEGATSIEKLLEVFVGLIFNSGHEFLLQLFFHLVRELLDPPLLVVVVQDNEVRMEIITVFLLNFALYSDRSAAATLLLYR